MALVNQTLKLEITPGGVPPKLHVTEYDENMQVVAQLFQRGQYYEIPSGTTAKVEGTLAGHPFSADATVDGSNVTFELTKGMTAYAGRAWTKIKLTKDSKPVSTCGFWLECDRAGVEADTVIGADGFQEQINQAVAEYIEDSGFQEQINQAVAEYIEDSELIIDSTLSRQGAAADAKATGDRLDALSEEIENLQTTGGKIIPTISIPKTIRILTGSEFNLYYTNVISLPGVILWCGTASGLTTKRYSDHLSITAAADGTYSLAWKLYDDSYNLLESGTLMVIAAADKAMTASALIIGDSTVTQGGYISKKLLSCFSEAGGTLTLIGTRGTAPALHEGRAGWKAADYCTKASDSTYTNPFYNNGFDFGYYMAEQGYSGVGVVIIQLGINDIFYMGIDNFSADATVGYINTMVASILAYDSNIKVIVDLLTPPNGNPSVFTEKYGTSQIDFIYRLNTIRMSKALIEHFSGNASVSISPNNCVLNPAQDINDGVHPTEGGYAKLGKIIYETMLGVHSGDSGGGQVAPLWDMAGRTGVQWQEYSLGNVGRAFGTDKYYYPMSFTGATQRPTAATMTDFAVGTDTLEFTIHAGSASASQLSGYGIVVPLALEAGKSYTFAAKCASANSGVNLMTYNVSDGVWTYVSNDKVCYSTTELCSASITPEAGKGYAICFSQKSGGVGTKNVFSQISLREA